MFTSQPKTTLLSLTSFHPVRTMKIVAVLLVSSLWICDGSLDRKLKNYELINSVNVHSVRRRSTDGSSSDKDVHLSAFGRNFSLHLRPDKKIFSKQFKAMVVHSDGSSEPFGVDKDRFYTGTVKGEENSLVKAYFEGDALTATIRTDKEQFNVEPAWRHTGAGRGKDRTMVAYRASDLILSQNASHPGGQTFCGSLHADQTFDDIQFAPYQNIEDGIRAPRARRAVTGNKICTLRLVADYRFYQGVGGSDLYITASYMVGVIDRVNSIYENTDFGLGVGYGFEIKGMLIHDGYNTGSNYLYNKDQGYQTLDLLEAFNQDSTAHSEYCLAHLFTNQGFSDSVLGLAYIASDSLSAAGGICSPVRTYKGAQMAFNTGWTSAKDGSGSTVMIQMGDLVTTHEFGHNWGSEHDPSSGDCAPSSYFGSGKYIMYTYSVSGDDSNNNKFSSCSKTYISAVLTAKADSCFAEPSTVTPCGNGLLDDGEECDGGSFGSLGLDPCCNPDCTLATGKVCSPVNYACCNDACEMAPAGFLCNSGVAGQCQEASYCTGSSLLCPTPLDKVNYTSCRDSGSCLGGICTPFCEVQNRISCVCDTVGESCHRCCRLPSTGICSTWNSTLILPAGRSCIQGTCNSEGTCIKGTTNLITRLWDIIDKIDIDWLIESFKDNMVACIVGFSLVIYVPICCAVWCTDRNKMRRFERDQKRRIRRDRTLINDEDKRKVHNTEKPATVARPHGNTTSPRVRNPNRVGPLRQR